MTPAPRENGWEELRREIEGLPVERIEGDGPIGAIEDFDLIPPMVEVVGRAAVLAMVDRLAAARGEPPEPGPAIDALDRIEQDAGWLHDNVPDYSPDGVATLRDIAREIAKAAYEIRAALRDKP